MTTPIVPALKPIAAAIPKLSARQLSEGLLDRRQLPASTWRQVQQVASSQPAKTARDRRYLEAVAEKARLSQ